MSAFAVIFERRGAPASVEALAAMSGRLAHRGADGCDLVCRDGCGLAHQHFWVTPEEVGERQPLADRSGRRLLVFDGRLDNREELLAWLPPRVADAGPPSDAALALAAYRRWGEGFYRRLLGPFALVLVDLERRLALCARDPLGDRTLFYRLDEASLLVASEEIALLAHPRVGDELDDRRLACYFALRVPADGASFFREVRELPPAHALRVDAASSRLERFWRPEELPRLEGRDERELAAEYRERLRQAVRCRLRAGAPPAVMMSGGIDSTSLAALAAEALRDAGSPAPVRAVSWVFDRFAACDERGYFEPVVDRWALESLPVDGDRAVPAIDDAELARNPGTPEENPYRRLKNLAYARAAAAGSRVILHGGAADALYAGAGLWLADLAREQGVGRGLVELSAELWRAGPVAGLRRAGAAGWARRLRRGLGTSESAWLTREARRWLDDEPAESFGLPPGARRRRLAAAAGARPARGITVEIFHASRCGVELRHPYRDRRLVELMLRLPAFELYRAGRFKPIARRAMAGYLPAAILERTRPTLLAPLFERGMRGEGRSAAAALLGSPEAEWRRWVRPAWLERGLRRSLGPLGDVVLWSCVGFELWRRRYHRRLLARPSTVSYNADATGRASG